MARLAIPTLFFAEQYDATTSLINCGAHPDQFPSAQTVVSLTFPLGAGEVTTNTVFSTTPAGSNNGARFRFLDNVGTNGSIGFNASSTGTAGSPNRQGQDGSIVYNAWNFSAATWDGSLNATGILLYFAQGSATVAEVTSYVSPTNGTTAVDLAVGSNLVFGNRGNADRTFNGSIAMVARWRTVLTLQQLVKVQRQGPLAIPDGLILCYANGRDYGPYGIKPITKTAVTIRSAPNIFYPLGRTFAPRTFVAPAAAYTLQVAAGSITFTGGTIGTRAARNLPVAPGAFSFTGATIGLRAARNLPIASGALSFVGDTIALRAARVLPVAAGAITFSGAAIAFTHGYSLAVVPSTVTFNGATVGLAHGYTLPVTAGAFSFSGATIGLRATRQLPVAPGAVTFTGDAITLTHGVPGAYVLVTNPASITLTGASIGLAVNRRLQVSPGAFSITGAALSMRVDRSLDVDPDSILFAGATVAMTWSGSPTPPAGFIHTVSDSDRTYRVDGNRTYIVPPR